SANICNRSMGLDTECDLTFEARGDAAVSEVIRNFRNRLLSEHLGVDPGELQQQIERSGSFHAAIAALQSDRRSLKTLDELPEWPETVIDAASLADPEQLVSLDRLMKEFSPARTTDRTRAPWGMLALAVLIIGGFAAMWRFTPLAELVSAEH